MVVWRQNTSEKKTTTLQYILAFCTKHTLATCQGLMTADNQHGKSVFWVFVFFFSRNVKCIKTAKVADQREKTISAKWHWKYNHSGWVLLFSAHLYASPQWQTTTYFSLSTGYRSSEKQQVPFTGSFVVRGSYGCQSLKDDSLSELVAAMSWSCPVPPSGKGASGVLWTEVTEVLMMSFTGKQILVSDIIADTHSSKLGSKPSKTILFLIAMTGTPWDKENVHRYDKQYLKAKNKILIMLWVLPLEPFSSIGHSGGLWPPSWHSQQELLLLAALLQAQRAAVRQIKSVKLQDR